MSNAVTMFLLLVTVAFQITTAYPYKDYDQDFGELLRSYYNQEHEIAEVNYEVKTGFYALTVFVKGGVLRVYRGAGPLSGTPLTTMRLPSDSRIVSSSTPLTYDNVNDKKLAFDPYYLEKNGERVGSVYYFNLEKLFQGEVRIRRRHGCTLFVSETDYPRIDTRMSYGADALGNHAGKDVFGDGQWTFWIAFNKKNYILNENSFSYDWEAHIVCVFE